MSFLNKLDNRLRRMLLEADSTTTAVDTSWKNPRSPDYERQYAEDCLYHTVGPATSNPRWVDKEWSSKSGSTPPEGFTPGGAAPRWTNEEIIAAFAGLPDERNFHNRDSNVSPASGTMGGAPLYRAAKMAAKISAASHGGRISKDLIEDCWSNGMQTLLKLLVPGADRAKSSFISWAITQVRGAMTGGVGGDKRTNMLLQTESNYYVTPDGQIKDRLPEVAQRPKTNESAEAFQARRERSIRQHQDAEASWTRITALGIPSLLKMTSPEQIYAATDIVKGDFRYESSPEFDAGNPFGRYSSEYYMYGNELAGALEAGDEERIQAAKNDLMKLMEQAENASVLTLGTKTGLMPGHTITTPDRASRMKIRSMSGGKPSKETGEPEEMQIETPKEKDTDESVQAREIFNQLISLCLNYDLAKFFKNTDVLRRAEELAVCKKGIGGYMTSNEFRFLIRNYGSVAGDYPGKGTMREKLDVPREAPGWWSAYEDTEIEAIPGSDETWESIWTRNGYPTMTSPKAIADEMSAEAAEFEKGFKVGSGEEERTVQIAINHSRKVKANGMSISRQKVAEDLTRAICKFQIVTMAQRSSLALEESYFAEVNGSLAQVIIEDDIDRRIMIRTLDEIIQHSNRTHASLIVESIKQGLKVIV